MRDLVDEGFGRDGYITQLCFTYNGSLDTVGGPLMIRQIEELIRLSGADAVGVAVRGVESRREILVGEGQSFHAASTMKICVMMEVFRQAELGGFSLDSEIPVRNEFRSIVDQSPYSMDVGDDSDAELYDSVGDTAQIRDLVQRMIASSSNLATNLLVDLVTAAKVDEFMRELGAEGLVVLRGVEDGVAFRRGLINTATAHSLMQVLWLLASGEVVSREASAEMVEILKGQVFNEGLPASLTAGVCVAHKTGWTGSVYHDAGIVYPVGHDPYAVAIMTRGLSPEKEAPMLVATLSRLICEWMGA